MNHETLRAAIYARISTTDQDNAMQVRELTEHVERRGWLLAGVYLQIAKSLGLKTMLGSVIESSIGVTTAAHLSPLVDDADVDGNLLIANDPYEGVKVDKGKVILPDRPGLGLTPATE